MLGCLFIGAVALIALVMDVISERKRKKNEK